MSQFQQTEPTRHSVIYIRELYEQCNDGLGGVALDVHAAFWGEQGNLRSVPSSIEP